MVQKATLLKQAYEFLDNVTPLKFNCGVLCGAKCCKSHSTNSTENPGMLLLPQEDSMMDCSHYDMKDSGDGKILVCNGKCNREMRPFSCRIFPFYARISSDERISLRVDPRAFNICPVALKKKGARHSVHFHRNATRAIRILMKDNDFKRELIKTSEFCEGLYSFYRKILKER